MLPRLSFPCFLFLGILLFASCHRGYDIPPRVLVFSKTAGYRHDCIPTAVAAIRKMCGEHGIAVDSTEDAAAFTEKNLRRYQAVLFLNTTGDVLQPLQESAFERYIQAGGGFVGVHAASDTEYGWTWFGGLVGGYFNGHPEQQNATLKVENHDHPATKHLKNADWVRWDEWYNFKSLNPNTQVLLSIDEATYKGGTNCQEAAPGGQRPCHPMSWYHTYDGGRAFYTALGHTKESYAEPDFLKHLLGGIRYAIGKSKRLDYSACRTPEQPDPTRFVKTVLANELTEPMELDLLPDGRVMFIERRGAVKVFNPNTGLVTLVAQLDVHSEHEDGLMGLALDPNYADNHWLYLYYSPSGNEAVNLLSRFVFHDDSLHFSTEKTLLEVAVQRQECCHTGGCIEFDADGLLYLSTGDNTNPFDSKGYSPSDERPGRGPWDAQKSSANANDLRGKILRIRPTPDGGYTCPPGNLFDRQPGTRPEIYVMGCRNPFRISLDSRRKLLFWGEVGPDAGEPTPLRGPAGHDEVNRAAKAGFYGWPYFVGDNKPYHEYDFSKDKPLSPYDALHPRNNSPNNTGVQDLPPAQPAFIWYPYDNSPEFPLVQNGGRNAMAGPVYYCDQYPAATRFPSYYDGKLITYDWMRNWMMAVTIDSSGNFSRMETFGDSVKLSRPMDMVVDKNGSIWVLEYGYQWFAKNSDARLSRIDYVRGNRPPVAQLDLAKNTGAAPFRAVFSAAKSRDHDGDPLEYHIDFGDGTPEWHKKGRFETAMAGLHPTKTKHHPLDSIVHHYAAPGTYEAVLRVRDANGAWHKSSQKVLVGNELPMVFWDFDGKNRSFYKWGDTLRYRIQVEDREDGSLALGRIEPSSVACSMDYLETGFDITSIAQGHQSAQQQAEYARGKTLIDRSDCQTCHAVDRRVNGPAYQDIAARYRKDEFAIRNLSLKVIKGGSGVWGETVMSAHPQISEVDAGEMVRWILSLGDPPKEKQNFPTAGTYILKKTDAKKKQPVCPGTFILKASYKDRGSTSQKPLTGSETIALRPAFQQAENADSSARNVRPYRPFQGDTVVLNFLTHNSFFLFKRCDLQGIQGISVGIGYGDEKYPYSGGRIEVHVDSPTGLLLGKADIAAQNATKMRFAELNIPMSQAPPKGFHNLYFVLKNEKFPSQSVAAVDWVRFEL